MQEQHLRALTRYDDAERERAMAALRRSGDIPTSALTALLDHPVGRWAAVNLLAAQPPDEAAGPLLEIVRRDRERAGRVPEHQAKYLRIRAIEALGELAESQGTGEPHAIDEIVEALGYFIDPAHPHRHKEVTDAVEAALARIGTDSARARLTRWRATD